MAEYSSSWSGLASISQLASQFMQAQYAWGQQQFAANSALTDQVVGDAMNLYGSLSGIGNTLMGNYSNFFQPEYQSLVQDANNYAGAARIQQAMGAAESGVAQNFNGQRNAALADLQSFGIDPSSGRYAQLDAAERTQEAAAAAGAGFQAEQATEATGRGLRSEALQLGSVMPSQATAAYNAAQGAATAGENAKLANAQEGVNMMGNPTQWGSIAQQLRGSSSGPGSGFTSNGANEGPSRSSGGGGGGGGRPSGGGGGGGGQRGGGGGGGGGGVYGSNIGGPMGITQIPGGGGTAPNLGTDQQQADALYGIAPNLGTDQQQADALYGTDPAAQQYDSGTTVDTSNLPSADAQSGFDQSSYDPYAAYDNSSGGSTDTSNPNPDTSNQDTSNTDMSSYDNSGYARGGAIPMHGKLDQGGQVPYDKSPSGGKVTDDVAARLHGTNEPIRLNAGEFVIPRHAVKWLGEKYFHDLIEKSKKARVGVTAKPTLKPALPAHSYRGASHG